MATFIKNGYDEIIIKLLHYFIVEQGYNPIILNGVKNEIWLEKLNGDYNIIKISSNYIHNDEQLDFDLFKTKQIMSDIKKKTLSFKLNTLSIFLNLGENVNLIDELEDITCVNMKRIKDLSNNKIVIDKFPNIISKTKFQEKGMELFMKITKDIGEKNEDDVRRTEDIFKIKPPIITYALIILNFAIFFLMYIIGSGSQDVITLLNFGASEKLKIVIDGEIWRLLTSTFLHIGLLHLLFNNYALYVVGQQIENFFGKAGFLTIYLGSAIISGLMSLVFIDYGVVSAGASGAIFGILGSLLYFGYYHRVYLGNVIKSQIIPLIILNLIIGFSIPGINNVAHIGGLISGILFSMIVGVKYKTTKVDRINGIVLTTIFTMFLAYLVFFN